MKPYLLVLLFGTLVPCFAKAQGSTCSEFYALLKKVDSLDRIALQRKGDTAFQRQVVFAEYDKLTLCHATGNSNGGWIVFQFNEQLQPMVFANLEACTEQYAKEMKLYTKSIAADQQTKVYKNKKDKEAIFFIGRGAMVTDEGKLNNSQPYLFIRYHLYL